MSDEQLAEKWKNVLTDYKKICDVGSQIDPNDSYCWLSLSMGFFLAKNIPKDDAEALASYCRYTADGYA